MDVDRFLDMERRTGVKNSDIDEFLAKANAVDEAIKGMREGHVKPEDVKIDGIDCDTEEEKAEKERKRLIRRAELEREAEELRIRRKEEERKKWWAGVELFTNNKSNEDSSISVDEIDKEQLKINMRKDRYSMDYSRWNQWRPTDPVSLKEIEEREEEEERKRNEEFEKNNAEWCQQYLKDIEERDKATAKKKRTSESSRLKGNKLFKAKKYDEAVEKYMEALSLTPYDGPAIVTNVAQAHIKLGQYDDALEFLDRAIALDPKNIKAHSRKAFVLSECIPNRLDEALQWAKKAYLLDEEHTNKEVSVQYNEIKIAVAEKKKEEKVNEVVVPTASKFSEFLQHTQNDTQDGSPSPAIKMNDFTDIMKELTTNKECGGNISTTAGVPVVDNLRLRLEEILSGKSVDDSETEGNLRNHRMFLDAALEILEGDSNIRVYCRTSGALAVLISLLRNGMSAIKEAKEDNRKADFTMIGKHMKVLAVAMSNERSSKLQLLEDSLFIEDVKSICAMGDAPGEVLEGCLLILFYGLDSSCSKLRNAILKDKTLLLTLGSALCAINAILSKKSKKHKPTSNEIADFSSCQLLCCQLIKDVVFADETKDNIASVAAAVVPILGSTLAAENNIPENNRREILGFVFESLLGCSQKELLRIAFLDSVLDSTSSTIDVILELCHEHSWMISNGLAILMNLTIKDLDGVDIRRYVYDAGATDLCLAILGEEDQYSGGDVSKYSFVRASGLMSRLSSISEVQEILQSATVYKTLCQRLIKNATLEENVDEPWIADERNQLIRVIAAIREIPSHGKEIGYSLQIPQLMISLLPSPRRELNNITPSSVILPPLRPLNPIVLGNAVLSLLPYADDKNMLADIYLGKSLGVEKLVCAMATCSDIRVRKNIAILLAKGCRDAEIKKKIEHFRGLQMIVELQKQLI